MARDVFRVPNVARVVHKVDLLDPTPITRGDVSEDLPEAAKVGLTVGHDLPPDSLPRARRRVVRVWQAMHPEDVADVDPLVLVCDDVARRAGIVGEPVVHRGRRRRQDRIVGGPIRRNLGRNLCHGPLSTGRDDLQGGRATERTGPDVGWISVPASSGDLLEVSRVHVVKPDPHRLVGPSPLKH